jgi:polyphosphate glucokinase
MSPDLFILGGGVSKYYDLYKEYIDIEAPIVQAKLLNNAGIAGAAMYTLETSY